MKKKNKILIILIVVLILIVLFIVGSYYKEKINTETTILDINKHFNNVVTTNKDSKIYLRNNNEYIECGSIGKDVILTLKEEEINENTLYFNITNMDEEYYIKYSDVNPINMEYSKDDRYKRYVVFNENITTDSIKLYKDDKLIYILNKSIELPIYIKDNDRYYVEYSDELFWVNKEEVEIISSDNTSDLNTKGIAVLNYHFFWNDKTENSSECNQIICHSTTQFREHLDYIKDNEIFTPTMEELEMYIDGKIRLPKSVVITIDDCWRADIGTNILKEYELNGTLFLITGDCKPDAFMNEYVEVHSHTDKLHTTGKCPGGQGGGIKCLPKDEILSDLKTSREKLNNSKVLCYPFYEFNNYSIDIVKEAGFTMAFAGVNGTGNNLVKVGSDKYRLPRFVIYSYTSVNDIKKYIG